jgi:hypothetical protein
MHSASISPAKPYEERFVKRFVGEEREECPICVDNDEFTYKSWVRLKACAHFFHQHCIDLWLEHKQTCPVCVQDVWGRKEEDNDERSVSVQIVVNHHPARFQGHICISNESIRCYCCVVVIGIVTLMATVIMLKQ